MSVLHCLPNYPFIETQIYLNTSVELSQIASFSPLFTYSASSIVRKMVDSLGLHVQFKEPKTCNIYDSRITLKLFYAENGYKKNVTFEKCRVWKAATRVAVFTKVTLAFYFVPFFFCLALTLCNFLQIGPFFTFAKKKKRVSFLEY